LVQEAYIEYQVPDDLGAEVQALDSRRLEMPKIYLNPDDELALRVRVARTQEATPSPYGRVQGPHQLFQRVQEGATTEEMIYRTVITAFIITFALSLGALVFVTFTVSNQSIVQVLLTVVTTMAGIIAGFISGRASREV
jgi:hypothetical protein